MKEIIKRNYESIKKRGYINSKTTHVDFMHKLNEEVSEVKNEIIKQIDIEKLCFELTDVILVCLCWMEHYGENSEKYIKEKIIINEKRKD